MALRNDASGFTFKTVFQLKNAKNTYNQSECIPVLKVWAFKVQHKLIIIRQLLCIGVNVNIVIIIVILYGYSSQCERALRLSNISSTVNAWRARANRVYFWAAIDHIKLGMLRSIGRRSVSADNHILWLDRYSLNLADLRNRSQLMTSMREDVHDEWGRKCFGAAVISSPVWNYFDVSRNNEKFAICRLCSK